MFLLYLIVAFWAGVFLGFSAEAPGEQGEFAGVVVGMCVVLTICFILYYAGIGLFSQT